MEVKKCTIWHGYHSPIEVDNRKTGDGATEKIHFCPDCQTEWKLKHLPDTSIMESELYYRIYAKDYLQPTDRDFEIVYGAEKARNILSQANRHFQGEQKLNKDKEELQDYRQHLSKGRVHIKV